MGIFGYFVIFSAFFIHLLFNLIPFALVFMAGFASILGGDSMRRSRCYWVDCAISDVCILELLGTWGSANPL